MRLKTEFRAEPIGKDIAIFLGDLEPRERSRKFAEFAAQHIAEAKAINAQVLGREPPSKTFVDGQANAPLPSVRPDGTIHTEFELILEVLVFISQTLERFSPVGRRRKAHGQRYAKSHKLLADGVEINIDTALPGRQLKAADEYIFINTAPYARKIERGSSTQAPDGVYQVTANLARRRYRNVARIAFSYRTVLGGTGGRKSERNPAISVRTGGR